MSGQIHRIKKDRDYVQLDTYVLRDKSLSWKAKGLHSYLMQLPDDWKIYIADLQTRSSDGRDSTAGGLNELIQSGYVVRRRILDENNLFSGYDYNIFERPEQAESWKSVNGKSVNGKSVNGKSVNGKSVTTNNESNQVLNTENIKEDSAAENSPLLHPFQKIAEIETGNILPVEAEKENTPPIAPAPPQPGATRVRLHDPALPGVTIVDDVPPQPKTKPVSTGRGKGSQTQEEIDLAGRVIEYLNQTAGRGFRVDAGDNAKGIIGRAREKFTEEEMKRVIDFKTAEWKNDPKMYQFLDPVTLFRPANFEKYLQAASVAKPGGPQQQPTTQPTQSSIPSTIRRL